MKTNFLNVAFILIVSQVFYCCTSGVSKTETGSSKKDTIKHTLSEKPNLNNKTYHELTKTDSITEYEKKIYFHIDQVYTGKVYSFNSDSSAFYRILIIPQEENIMILAENIAVIDNEGSNLKLRKLSRLTDDGSILPKFGLSSVDSIKFIDSVTIEGYFNDKKKVINLDKLKKYHPSF
jgi:hypothetical protein